MHRLKWSLIILTIVAAINAYGWGLHKLLEARSNSFPVECVTYADLQEVQTGLLERGFRHSAFLGLANSKGGERADGSEYGYFRIDPTYISDYVVCFYDWPAPRR